MNGEIRTHCIFKDITQEQKIEKKKDKTINEFIEELKG